MRYQLIVIGSGGTREIKAESNDLNELLERLTSTGMYIIDTAKADKGDIEDHWNETQSGGLGI